MGMTTKSPFFSITIPAYNRGYILTETIRSIQDQSFSNWEVIVVDDGSKDNTREIVEQLASEDPRIRYVYQQNAERSAARNNGADHAKGDYLMFLDSDDKYADGHLEKLYAFIQEKECPVALFFSNMSYLTDKGIEIPEIPTMLSGKEFEYLLLQPITPSRVCIHRDIFKDFRFDPKIVIVEDLVLWVCIATKYPAFQLCENTLWYRIHDGNSVDLSRNSYFDRYKGLLRLFNDADYRAVSAKIDGRIKNHLLAECAFNMARHFEFVKNFKQMNAELMRSFKHSPAYRNKERLFMYLNHQTFGKQMLKLMGKGKTA
jgi:glycosyltransferase involved in cell wall biosynthesis